MAPQEGDSDAIGALTLVCTELNPSESLDEILISTADIHNWDLPSILTHSVVKIRVNRSRLIEESSYFRGLLLGRFCESRLDSVALHWNPESILSVLRFIFGCHLDITSDNFVTLSEAALFFGVETLLLKCQVWLNEVTSYKGFQSPQLCLDGLIHIWKYGLEHANDSILQLCTSYLARNFMWASSFNSFADIPHELLFSCIKHSDLTLDSEKHLFDAIQVWLTAKTAKPEGWSNNVDSDVIRINLLPLWFAAGKRGYQFFSMFADEATGTILSLARHPNTRLKEIFKQGDLSHFKVRLTKFTQKVDLSGCPQITPGLFLLSILPSDSADSMFRKIIEKSPMNFANVGLDGSLISQATEQMLSFEAVQEVDISNCPSLPLGLAFEFLCKSFPSLRTLKAAYFLNFKTPKLCHFLRKFPLLTSIDLTLDISPVIPARVSIVSSSQIPTPQKSMPLDGYDYHSAASLSLLSWPFLSNITKLTLDGRTDINDSDLYNISEVCESLNFVNMRGCTSVTDCGLSVMILKCKKLHSMVACDTSFGNNSALALCSSISSKTQQSEKYYQSMPHKLQTLHIGGCNGIDGTILSELMLGAGHLRSLCLREIQLVDDALYRFQGSSLQMLDVSETKVSCNALSRVICRNLDLKFLKTRGCTQLVQEQIGTKETKLCLSSFSPKELFSDLGKSCQLEEIELGWGFSFLSFGALKPAIRTLRTLTIGLGASLGLEGLKLIPITCPLLEMVVLYFQVISDSAITKLIKTLPHLRSLSLCYCFGGISSLSFRFKMPNLMKLKLERVTPWMTNEDLMIMADNCTNLNTLSLKGCTLLNSESQNIISRSWPGLTSLHLEECGEITANGIKPLFNCCALEDLVLRHTGPGIPRNFIIDAASKLPMLRKISLDICDATDGDYDLPSFHDRYFLGIVKIARCKLKRCTLDLHNLEARRIPVHMETLALVWNSETLTRTVVKERL
ncbi:BTB/POZ domain-containing protein FBL11 isoform X1 [Primulina tabacum]|uniref:BTB/POZ domain-containing protein FBL11 isoform X1 n=1 Tax=Primulina tabacum TaxID=48773 RepID=UPI003F5A672D